jgi:hypothetical protein
MTPHPAARHRALLILHLVEGTTWLTALVLGAHRFLDVFRPDWLGGEVHQLVAAALLFSAARFRVVHPGRFGASILSGLCALGAVVVLFWPAMGPSLARAWSLALGLPFLVGWLMFVRGDRQRLSVVWRHGGWMAGWAGLLLWAWTHERVEPVWSLPAALAQAGFNTHTNGAVERGTPAPFGAYFVGFANDNSPAFSLFALEPKSYQAGDIITRNGPLYRCLQPHVASLNFADDVESHWDLILRPNARQRNVAQDWTPGEAGAQLHQWNRAHGKGLRFAVAWLSPDGNQAIVQLERFQGAWLLAVGIGLLILGTFAAGFQTFRASLQDHVGNTPVPRNA